MLTRAQTLGSSWPSGILGRSVPGIPLPRLRTRTGRVLLLGIALGCGLLVVTTHRWGLGVNYDSVVYVQASHNLSSIPLPQPRDHGGEALYGWPPIYPLALKLFGGGYSGRVC